MQRTSPGTASSIPITPNIVPPRRNENMISTFGISNEFAYTLGGITLRNNCIKANNPKKPTAVAIHETGIVMTASIPVAMKGPTIGINPISKLIIIEKLQALLIPRN